MKLLVERKQAFSAGAVWVARGPRLMGSKATIKAQVAQIEKEKKSAAEMATKKANKSVSRLRRQRHLLNSSSWEARCHWKLGRIL